MFRFIASLGLVALAALLQLTNYAFIAGVKPNFTFVAILIFALIYTDWLKRAILIFIAALVLKFNQGIELENILFILSSLMGILIIDKLPSSRFINSILAVLAATLFMNIFHFEVWPLFKEMAYNILIFLSFYGIYQLWHGVLEKKR